MEGKVLSLVAAREKKEQEAQAAELAPIPELVELIEELLESAKSGKLRSIAYVAKEETPEAFYYLHNFYSVNYYETLGHIKKLEQGVLTELLEDESYED